MVSSSGRPMACTDEATAVSDALQLSTNKATTKRRNARGFSRNSFRSSLLVSSRADRDQPSGDVRIECDAVFDESHGGRRPPEDLGRAEAGRPQLPYTAV